MNIDDVIDAFRFFSNWEERYQFLIELGEQLPPMDPEYQTDDTRVHGCMSKVWIVAQPSDDDPSLLSFMGDSDASTVKGLVAILIAAYANNTPREILSIDADKVFEQLGLYDHLSPTRHVGVYAMVEHIKRLASAFLVPGAEVQHAKPIPEAGVSQPN